MSIQSNNKKLRAVKYDKFGLLEGFIDNIRNRYRVNLNFHDIAGVSSIDPVMEKILGPYIYHNNHFCNYVKKNSKGFKMCTQNKDVLCACCKKAEAPFYGRCYMGVEEYVFPIKWGESVIAFICVGQFFEDIDTSLEIIKKSSLHYGIEFMELKERFLETARKIDFSVSALAYDIGLLCDHILMLYMNYITQGKVVSEKASNSLKAVDLHKRNYIVTTTLRFIKENYNKDISLKILASNSFCNPSYLSYIFKEKTGVNVIDYIHRVRIDAAMQLLDISDKSITEICIITGFNDSGYFSRVFKQMCGCSPKEYRERRT